MKRTFVIELGETDAGQPCAIIQSVQEKKAKLIQAPNMKLLMAALSKLIRKRASHLQRFPLPEPSIIISAEDGVNHSLIVTPGRNGH